MAGSCTPSAVLSLSSLAGIPGAVAGVALDASIQRENGGSQPAVRSGLGDPKLLGVCSGECGKHGRFSRQETVALHRGTPGSLSIAFIPLLSSGIKSPALKM